MGECRLCGGSVASNGVEGFGVLNHPECHNEYASRVAASMCVACGKAQTSGTYHCDACPMGEFRDYPGGA